MAARWTGLLSATRKRVDGSDFSEDISDGPHLNKNSGGGFFLKDHSPFSRNSVFQEPLGGDV